MKHLLKLILVFIIITINILLPGSAINTNLKHAIHLTEVGKITPLFDYIPKKSNFSVDTEPPNIISAENIKITIPQGEKPILPIKTFVIYDNNSKISFDVTWEEIDKYSYQIPGEIKVNGIINKLELPVECIINITPTRELGFNLIRDDTYVKDTITVNNNDNYKIPDVLSQRIYDTLLYYKSTYGIQASFTAVSLKDYTTISYNADLKYSPASTLKAPYALYIYKEISKGNLDFDDYVVYKDHFWEISSGIIKYSSPGTKWSLRDILYHTIDISDNTGYYMLRYKGGTKEYKAMLDSLNCSTPNPNDPWGYITPHDLSVIWNEIYNFSFTCEEGELFLDTLINAKYNFIKEGLNSYEKVAHKSGFNNYGYHDSAIIFGDSDPNTQFVTNNYILTIMTKTYSYNVNGQLLSQLSKDIDLIMKDLTIVQNKEAT